MKYRAYHYRRSGFTLTELVIVLAVVGVLIAGLWNLLSGANSQIRDESTANQHTQLISAVKAFLASDSGQQYMISNSVTGGCGGTCAAGASFALPLPTNNSSFANCQASYSDANLKNFCAYIPPGFSTSTQNSYSQSYSVRVLRDSSTAAGLAPTSYSFMVVTTGGNTIPDSSGARIASLIGGDGGFVYTAATCTAAASTIVACGAFGGWSATVTTGYGFAAASYSGDVASRTYVTPQQNSFSSWLARVAMAGDSNFVMNTMTTPEYLGGNQLVLGRYQGGTANLPANNKLLLGDYNGGPVAGSGATNNSALEMQGGTINFALTGAATGGGTMNMQGGTINVGGGTIKGIQNTQISLDLETSPGTLLTTGPGYNSFIYLNTRCSVDSTAAANDPILTFNAGCVAGMQDHGDGYFGGRVNVNSLYATTFIYQSSDMRLKTNIQKMANPLADIMKLNPVTFTFKSSGKDGIGVVAQDVEKVYPQLVSERQDGMKSVNYEGLIAPLIGAVQELKKENDQLREQIREQAMRQQELERRLQK